MVLGVQLLFFILIFALLLFLFLLLGRLPNFNLRNPLLFFPISIIFIAVNVALINLFKDIAHVIDLHKLFRILNTCKLNKTKRLPGQRYKLLQQLYIFPLIL